VHKVRGQGTVLSPLAEKLIWADRRISARLSPLLDSLASELQQELASLLAAERPPAAPDRLARLRGGGAGQSVGEQGVTVDINTAAAPRRWRRWRAASATWPASTCRSAIRSGGRGGAPPWLNPDRHMPSCTWPTASRACSSPRATRKASGSLDDLLRPDLRFVNRQHGSGTRVLLELLLADRALDPHRPSTGFDSAEFTHAAVAAYVASGMADVSFGVETAARRFDLDFIPVCRERYFLACNKGALATPSLQAAREAMAQRQLPQRARRPARLRRPISGPAYPAP
jgi:hypothetical protein